jgi:hypothetical protein
MPEIVTLKCPFCKQGDISIAETPPTYSTQTIRVGSNRKTIPKLMPGKKEVLTEKCLVCGHTKTEIQKALKEGIKPSREEIIKRMKEAGLPLKI